MSTKNKVKDGYCDNTLIINNKEYKLEKVWRRNKNDKTLDAKGKLFPFPTINKSGGRAPETQDIVHILHLLNAILDTKKKYVMYDQPRSCLLCDKKKISTKYFMYEGYIWEDGLVHYIDTHNIQPSIQFKKFILNDDSVKQIIARPLLSGHLATKSDKKKKVKNMRLSRVVKNNRDYVVVERNQLHILDALMIHGGYQKKYIDLENNFSRYSEHAGYLDFEDDVLSKIIVSGKTLRIDDGDNEIYLPMDMDDMFEYEYIFHTHPPTPRPGGRAEDGILYEFPSIGDIYHFIDHHNEGNVIGSIVIAAEGMYNIRKSTDDASNISVDEEALYKKYQHKFYQVQKKAIIEYGTKFNTNTFFSKIAQDRKYIDKLNDILNQFNIQIDYYPRKKDNDDNWIIDTVFLVFRQNKPKSKKT
jgi:hypothetical protein